jgi:hypothetical protein
MTPRLASTQRFALVLGAGGAGLGRGSRFRRFTSTSFLESAPWYAGRVRRANSRCTAPRRDIGYRVSMRVARTILLVSLAAACSTLAGAQCPVGASGPCAIDLRGENTPRLSRSCSDDAWKTHLAFELPDRFADADANGWHETVLQIDVDPKRGCGCVVFRITYEGEPRGFSVNIGDSPTNDGYGGDEWSTRFDAELEIVRRDLTAFGSERPGAPADLQIFGMRALPIAGRVLELEVCDQSIRFAIDPEGSRDHERAFNGFFHTHHSRDLFTIRPSAGPDKSSGDQPDSRIYAAFNRVIHRRAGRPAQDRFGSGVRRVEISLTP